MPKRISGKLFSGLAQGCHFTQLDWLQEQWRTKLGFIPHPGTFNIRIGPEYQETARELIEGEAPIEITPPSPDFCPAKCYRASIGGTRAAIVVPVVPGYPRDVLEVLAPVNLRNALSVADGDEVSLVVED